MSILQPTLQDVIKYADGKVAEYHGNLQRRLELRLDLQLSGKKHPFASFLSDHTSVNWSTYRELGLGPYYQELHFHAKGQGRKYPPLGFTADFYCYADSKNYCFEVRDRSRRKTIGRLKRQTKNETLTLEVRAYESGNVRPVGERNFNVFYGKRTASSNLSITEAQGLLRLFFENILEGKK